MLCFLDAAIIQINCRPNEIGQYCIQVSIKFKMKCHFFFRCSNLLSIVEGVRLLKAFQCQLWFHLIPWTTVLALFQLFELFVGRFYAYIYCYYSYYYVHLLRNGFLICFVGYFLLCNKTIKLRRLHLNYTLS